MKHMFIHFTHKISNSYKEIKMDNILGKTNFAKHFSAKITIFKIKSMQINLLQELLLLVFIDTYE